ncbi:MAG: hypothetical protein K2N75_07925 [Helicobacter sp.]|uniref:hypothetical protein n=1 Tax=Helicobacter sp. TaxID=218 RepID=UPI0023D4EDB1|nr:hypothetical protein [Helicobacter sp.]MDE5926443.1 hypothetical protein [Helicobacter sp.]MDE7175948.1 hypothetical protein [Helicobacter sp.]
MAFISFVIFFAIIQKNLCDSIVNISLCRIMDLRCVGEFAMRKCTPRLLTKSRNDEVES